MLALTFQGIEQVGCETLADPRIEFPGDAIVAVRLAGVCGSDLHVYHGRETGLDPGTAMGHEFVGEVLETGHDVNRIQKGSLVVSPFTTSCGDCDFCLVGLTARCQRGELFGWRQSGAGLHGAQAEMIRVPLADSTLVEVPQGISPENALLAGDVLSTGYFCAHQGGVRAGSSVAVVGCGPVGLMAVLAAKHLGAERVFAIDRLQERLGLAARFGAEPLDLSDSSPPDTILEATRGLGVHVVLEAVGSPQSSLLAMRLVRPGGTISAVGVHTEPQFAFSPVEAYDKNLTYKIGRCPARRFMDTVLPWLADSDLDPAAIISHRLPLTAGDRAYDIFAKKLESCTKAVLIP
jgi:threonine dehydrogenase-like Zn-dependent dehydrogenase